jgi:hypothetical protein
MCPTLGPGVLDDWVKLVCVSLMHPDSIAVSAPISPPFLPPSVPCAPLLGLLCPPTWSQSANVGQHMPSTPPHPLLRSSHLCAATVCHYCDAGDMYWADTCQVADIQKADEIDFTRLKTMMEKGYIPIPIKSQYNGVSRSNTRKKCMVRHNYLET